MASDEETGDPTDTRSRPDDATYPSRDRVHRPAAPGRSASMIGGDRTWSLLRSKGPGVAADIAVNILLPYLVYSYAAPALGDVEALLASSIPPLLWSGIELIRHRRLDAMSLFVIAGIVLSILAFLGGGGARMLQLREKLVSGVLGLAFLASVAIGRPLLYELARAGTARGGAMDADRLPELHEDAGLRRSMSIMTIVWGFGLILDTAIGAALVFSLTIKAYMIVNTIEGYAVLGGLAAWTFWYGRRDAVRTRRGKRER